MTADDRARVRPRRPPPWHGGAATAAALCGAAAAAVTLLRLPSLLYWLGWYPDVPATMLAARALAEGGTVPVPTQTGAALLGLDVLLEHLPAAWALELAVGPLMLLATILVLVGTVWRLLGARAALLTGVVAVAVPPASLATLLFQVGHGITLLGSAVLAAWSVRIASGSGSAVTAVLVAAFAGVVAVSDPQFAAAGLVPLAVAVAAAWWCTRRTGVAATGALTLAGAAVATAAGFALLPHLGIRAVPALEVAATPSLAASGAGVTVATLWIFASGTWWQPLPGPWLVTGAVLLVLALPLPYRCIRRELAAVRSGDDRAAPRLAWAVFWSASAVMLPLSLIVLGLGRELLAGHYLSQLLLSAAALLPLELRTATPRGERLRFAAAAVFAASCACNLALLPAEDVLLAGHGPSTAVTGLASFLAQRGLHRGYAGYWDSTGVTWNTGGDVSIWPVTHDCNATVPESICRYPFGAPSWYTPRAGPSFVVLRSGAGCAIRPPQQRFGPPAETLRTGPYTVLVYPYDVASRLSTYEFANCFP